MHAQLQSLVSRAWQDIAVNGWPVAIGIDAAANDENWGLCVLTLTLDLQSAQMPLLLPQPRINASGQTSPTLLCRPSKDALLGLLGHLTELRVLTSIGVDIPFGWPDGHRGFVDHWAAQAGWSTGGRLPARTDFERRWCDQELRRRYPFIQPLSVGADTIAQAAFCWATFRQELHRFPMAVDLGLEQVQTPIALFETYPAAFVKLAAADFGNYKKKPAVRHNLLSTLISQYPLVLENHSSEWLEWACEQRGSPNAFDAFLCALCAWDHLRHRVQPGSIPLTTPAAVLNRPLTQLDDERIRREGWILVRDNWGATS